MSTRFILSLQKNVTGLNIRLALLWLGLIATLLTLATQWYGAARVTHANSQSHYQTLLINSTAPVINNAAQRKS